MTVRESARPAFGWARPAVLAGWPLLAVLAGCGGPQFGDGDFRCGEAPNECPPGFTCAGDGFCRRSDVAADGSTPGDAGSDGAGGDGAGGDAAGGCGDGVPAAGEICYGAPSSIPTGLEANGVALGDLNGDMATDIVTIDRAQNVAVVRQNDGAGGFSGSLELPCGLAPLSLAVRDVNGDMRADIVTADFDGDTATLFYGDGAATAVFGLTITLPSSSMPVGVAMFDNVGERDIAVMTQSPAIFIYNNNGGAFNPGPTAAAPGSPRSIVSAQIDGMHGEDLIATGAATDEVFLFPSTNTGTLASPTPYPVASGPTGIAVLDMDFDTNTDIVVAHPAGGFSLLVNDGTGAFQPAVYFPGSIGSIAVAALDANGDGAPDVAVAGTDGVVELHLNIGSGDFALGGSFGVPQGATAIAAGDLNGDLITDLAISATDSGGTVTVILSDP